jgi:AcrR family transcriptional regulator
MPSLTKPSERATARRKRAVHGTPMKQIAAELGVSVSTVSLWVRDIEIAPEHVERNLRRGRSAFADTWREKNRMRRREYQDEGRLRARQMEPLHMAGCMLYWAEGSKNRNCAKLANSDLNMVGFFRGFLSKCFGVSAERFSLRLNVYLGNGLAISEIEQHWLEAVELPRDCLRKHSINHFPTSSSGKKANHLPYGVCTIGVCDTWIVQHIYGAIKEYGGFDEPRWLDCDPAKTAANLAS